MTKLNRFKTDMIEDRTTGTKLSDKLTSLDTTINQKANQTDLDSTNSQLAQIVTNVNNYKSYALNVGQSNEDWSPAIQQAVNYVSGLGGGKVLLPVGNMQVMTPVTVPSGVTIEGVSRLYHQGSRITIGGTNSYAFFIGSSTSFVIFHNFVIDGRGLANGNTGILCQGAYPNSSYRIRFSELDIYGMDKCIAVIATDGGKTWQCDNVFFDHCQFVESNYGIYGDAFNFDYIKVLECWIDCKYGIYMKHCGRLNVDSCSGAYEADQVNSQFIHLEIFSTVVIQSCESEAEGKFLVVDSGGAGQTYPVTLLGNVINNDVNINSNIPLVSIGNQYAGNVVFQNNAGDCVVTSTNDRFINGTNWSLFGNTMVHATGYSENNPFASYISTYNTTGFPVNVTNQLLTDTNNDFIINVRTRPNGNYLLYVYYTVVTAATNVTVTAGWNDIQTSHQSKVLDSGSKAVGSYTLTPLFINNNGDGGTQRIQLQVQAGTANQVYVSASLVKL